MEILKQEELSSLKRQNISRALSFGQTTISGDSRLEDDCSYDEKALETDQQGSLITKEANGIIRLSSKQVYHIVFMLLLITLLVISKFVNQKYDSALSIIYQVIIRYGVTPLSNVRNLKNTPMFNSILFYINQGIKLHDHATTTLALKGSQCSWVENHKVLGSNISEAKKIR